MFASKIGYRAAITVGVIGLAPASASADAATFIFADVGTTHTGFFFPDNPLVGQEVVLARVFLEVEVFPGADAADFDTDMSFPITPLPGNRNAFGLSGADLGWSGSGMFTHSFETTEFNGTFISTIFGAATAPMDAMIIKGSRVEMVTIPAAPASAAMLVMTGLLALRRRR